jgi:hypothetical protein
MAPRYRLQQSIGRKASSVTTGTRMFVDPFADGRSAWARRWNDLVLMHAADLGGLDMLSEAQISICRRASAIECELEAMEGRMSAGTPIDIAVYARLTGCLARLLELVGISGAWRARLTRQAPLPRPCRPIRQWPSMMTPTRTSPCPSRWALTTSRARRNTDRIGPSEAATRGKRWP